MEQGTRKIYGVNRFYEGKTKTIDKTDWFFNIDEALFATTQHMSSKRIITGIYHYGSEEPWIEITENTEE